VLPDPYEDGLAQARRLDVQAPQDLEGDAIVGGEQTQQEVLGPDVIVAEAYDLLLGEDDDATGPIGEAFEHCARPRLARCRRTEHRAVVVARGS